MKRARSYLLILVITVFSTATNAADFEVPKQELVTKFFGTNNVSLTPVYAVMKNGNDHVVTVHGFVDNSEICKEFVDVLNKPKKRLAIKKLFACVRLNDGSLK